MLNSKKPVYIYGMGNGAEKIIRWCEYYNIKVSGVFASDEFVRGQSFCGYTVKTLGEAEQECGSDADNADLLVLLAFGTSLPDVMEHIENIGKKHELYAPDVPVIGEKHFDKQDFISDIGRAKKAYELLSDDESRKTFVYLNAYKITGKLDYLRSIFTNEQPPLRLDDKEIYCDLGAYNGDTIREFVKRTNCRYRRIYALEPEKRNFQKCLRSVVDMKLDNVELHNAAAWSEDGEQIFDGGSGRQAKITDRSVKNNTKKAAVRSLDDLLGGRECTYIKYDVEGADIPALNGSKNTIKKFSPKICCALYHRCYDHVDIPLYINSIKSGYKFYMRQSPYYPAWETNIYAVNADN